MTIPSFSIKIAQVVIKSYAFLVSPLLGANKCRFYPSCSNYAHQALGQHGFLKGAMLSLRRIFRCHPWYHGNMIDPVPSSIDWKTLIGYNSACKDKCRDAEKS